MKRIKVLKSQQKRFRLVANAQYGEGDTVDTPDGVGVVAELYEEDVEYDGETFEGSSDSPVYEVVLESEDTPFGFFKASEMEETDIDTDVDSPEEDVEDVSANVTANDTGFRSWPDSWREADTPARLIALDAWTSMGGTWTGCFQEIGSQRICSAFKDEMYQTTEWRGGWTA